MGRGGRSGTRGRIALVAAVLCLVAALAPQATSASVGSSPAGIGQVRYIYHGLTVQPPHKGPGRGNVKQALFNQYRLQTQKKQKASVAFRDGTLLQLNQLTDALLRTSSLTQVRKGEVEQVVAPGTHHDVQTASAVASAIGTKFDVQVKGAVTIVTVIEGAVLVSAPNGSVVVKSGQQTRVKKGQAPKVPSPAPGLVDAWASSIPGPTTPLGLNIALDANGGRVYAFSSQRGATARTTSMGAYSARSPQAAAGQSWDAANIDDGRLDVGWQSGQGKVTDQQVKLEFQGGRSYAVTSLLLDCAATGGESSDNDMKDFEIKVSSSGKDESGFTSALQGTCKQQEGIQLFPLPAPIDATYVELDARDNYGGADGIAVAEMGVISTDEPRTLGTPTPAPSDTPTPTATPTATSLSTSTATATATATFTPVPKYLYSFSGLQAALTDHQGQKYVLTVSGQVCGDPATTYWTFTTVLSSPFSETAQERTNFSAGNPYAFFSFQDQNKNN